jgi:hypothetical protein
MLGRWWESLKRLKVITMLSSLVLMEKVWWISIHWLIYLTG